VNGYNSYLICIDKINLQIYLIRGTKHFQKERGIPKLWAKKFFAISFVIGENLKVIDGVSEGRSLAHVLNSILKGRPGYPQAYS